MVQKQNNDKGLTLVAVGEGPSERTHTLAISEEL